MILNQDKFKNSIRLEMDMYNPGEFLRSASFPCRHKMYEFELFEDDILKSPFNHKVLSCEMKIKVSTKTEINQLIEFLENLKTTILSQS